MLLYCCADLLLKALDESDTELPPDVQRAMAGLKRAMAMTLDGLQPDGTPKDGSASAFGPSTLAAAREFVQGQVASEDEDGTLVAGPGLLCPCCGQLCKMYGRKMYAEMGAWLIWLVQAYKQDPRWYSVNEGPAFQHRKGGGDYGKLVHWKLVERAPNDMAVKRTSGLWRPTGEGMRFAMGDSKVPSHVYLFNNKVYKFSDEQVDIKTVLGEHFDYFQLMHRT